MRCLIGHAEGDVVVCKIDAKEIIGMRMIHSPSTCALARHVTDARAHGGFIDRANKGGVTSLLTK
jgi:hypothetical protein